jgi:DNA polymerase I-like protein with 3'-5' exonuclease and polymerase domains
MLTCIDIETKALPEWEHDEDASLNSFRSSVSIIAIANNGGASASWDISGGVRTIAGRELLGHNLKFDLRHLIHQGYNVDVNQLCEDTQLMAVAFPIKVPESYLVGYRTQRDILNKEAGEEVHRKAGRYSLKTLAPYFLNVAPFWEVKGHQDLEYAKKDAVYTWELYQYFLKEFEKYPSAYKFYKEKLIPWARMILTAELRGVAVDATLLEQKSVENEVALAETSKRLDEVWSSYHRKYAEETLRNLRSKYDIMCNDAIAKRSLKTPVEKIKQRYDLLYANAAQRSPTKINFGSPKQLTWLLKGQMGLDIETFSSTSDDVEESTGKAVLQRLAAEDITGGIRTFLEYRKLSKLHSAFFPTYKEIRTPAGNIHCSFNMGGTRTGRLSCTDPNLQQVPKELRRMFVAREGHSLVVRDLSSIEPFLIAYITEDERLCKLLIEGRNFHSNNVRIFTGVDATDKEVKEKYGKERDLAKEIALSMLYGAGAGRMEESSTRRGIPWTFAECKRKNIAFKQEYQGVYRFKEELDEKLHNKELVYNLFNRPLFVEAPDKIFMNGFNTYIQGSASDLLLDWAHKSWVDFPKAHPLLFVHDELIFEVPTALATSFDQHLTKVLSQYRLETKWGPLTLTCEGGVTQLWEK